MKNPFYSVIRKEKMYLGIKISRLLCEDDTIKAVDKHTKEDGTLDDDISCILEEIKNCKRLVSRDDVSEPSKIIPNRAYFECILVDGTRVDFDKLCTSIEEFGKEKDIICFYAKNYDTEYRVLLQMIPKSQIKQIINHYKEDKKMILRNVLKKRRIHR